MPAKNTMSSLRPRPLAKRQQDEGLGLSPKTIYRLAAGVAAFGLLLIAVAAFSSGRPKATVSGRVMYKGKTVIWGSVIVAGADGRAASGRIEPDGTYTVTDAPVGEVALGVVSKDPLLQHYATQMRTSRERVSVKKWQPPPVDRKKWFPLPNQYEDPKTSGLALKLTNGGNEHNIVLP
jgi:hypothetical protein